VKRIRRRNARALLEAAVTLVGEGVRMGVARGGGEPRRDRLRRALCSIAERLALADEGLERMIAEIRCGHRRGAWVVELAPMTRTAPELAQPAKARTEERS
jgi:hypothetical protein